jgi:YD repeat-containing protein
MNAKLTASFNSSANQSTVNTLFANGALCSTTVGSYRSTADFVDEVRVIPGVFLVTSSTTTNSGACGSSSGTVTFTYDAQRRLTQQTTSVGGTTTWTAWDGSGRPTTGSSPGVTYVQAYDDAARTVTTTTTNSSGASVGVLTFDANGNQIRNEVSGAAGTSITTFSITSTDRVCK